MEGTWFPLPSDALPRGAVLLAPPWTEWGRAYFHRRGRIEALRAAGYACLSFDMGGFGGTTPTRGFRDRDAEAALSELQRRAPGIPLHVWGVSSGGHWLHPLLARVEGVRGAVFEDVTPHLLEWSAGVQPSLRPAFRALRAAFPRTDRFMDMRNHAAHLRVRSTLYVAGGADPGIPETSTRDLAKRAGAACLMVERAGHLQAIKQAGGRVLGAALMTFEAAGRR